MKKLKKSELIFLIAWILFLFTLLLGSVSIAVENVELDVILKMLRYLAYGICAIKILFSEIKQNKFIPICLMALIFFLSSIKSSSRTMALYSLILLASLSIDGKIVIKITAIMQGITLFVTILFSQIGILQDYVFVTSGERIRHGLGFSWTTTGAILYFYFMLCLIYLKKEKLRIWEILCLEMINYWFYKMTDSRMTFALSSCFLIFFAIQSLNKKKWKVLSHFKLIYGIFPFLMFGFTLLVYSLYDSQNEKWMLLNSLLSGRLRLGSAAIEEYGFSLLGHNIEWIGYSILRPTLDEAVGYNYVDSSYLQLTLNYGFIFILAVLSIYSIAIYKAIKSSDYYLVMIYICILVFALTEPRLMNFAYNPFPLLAFCRSDRQLQENTKNIEMERRIEGEALV